MTQVGIASLLMLLSLVCSQWGGPARTAVAAESTGLIKTGNATLNKALAPYSPGKAIAAENLTVVPIVSFLSSEGRDKYLSLDEALQKKLLTVREVSRSGSVPVLEVVSHADAPIFLPFGSIMTGGKQDRMLRDDVLLQAKERRKINVYCIEQGRWRPGRGGGVFRTSQQMAPQSLKSLGTSRHGQGEIWSKVSERNRALGNRSASQNVQGTQETEAFKKLSKRLKSVRDGVAKQPKVCGAVVVLDGKVVGTEIFAGKAYFNKIWPQLFNSYVVDAASTKEKVKTAPAKAKDLAEAFLAKIASAKVTERSEKDAIRLTVKSDAGSGQALIEKRKGRLVYFRFFPKPDESATRTDPRQASRRRDRLEGSGRFSAAPLARAIPPSPSLPAGEIGVDNTAESLGNNRWKWTVFVKADRQGMDRIKCVRYTLHPTFPNPVRLVCEKGDSEHPFGLSATGWGTFTVGVRVFMKDQSHVDLKHELRFR